MSKVKPVVVYAVGRTESGKRAAKSHSGSLAGDYAVTRGVLQHAGVVVLTQSDHLLPVTEALQLEARHFITCIETGTRPVTDGHAGLRVLELLEAATMSMRNRGVRVDVGVAEKSS